MNQWDVSFTDEAKRDYNALDPVALNQVDKAIRKVSQNPLPESEGGYGKPLGHKRGRNLTGYFKIKLKKLGIRVVYKLVRTDEVMKIIIVAAREDDEVYDVAARRIDT